MRLLLLMCSLLLLLRLLLLLLVSISSRRSHSSRKLSVGRIPEVVEHREAVHRVRIDQVRSAQRDVGHGRRAEQGQVVDAAPVGLITARVFVLLEECDVRDSII